MKRLSVRVDGLSKRYRIPHPQAPRGADYLLRPTHALRRPRSLTVDALSEVSFRVHEGEVLGVIGRNGAGKSTLLKILARITAPSDGEVKVAGRIASLLEVGTGFHPELTGRENVYLNGMLLGMARSEVDRAFGQICEFAGIGPYINVPIKRYSSGMQLRLAFAVAAHLAADTMIIDEVLAVGDAEFQRKCLGAMREVSRQGRTTLFVSHNMAAVESLCDRVVWLDRGRVKQIGSPEDVIRDYLRSAYGSSETKAQTIDLTGRPRGWTLEGAELRSIAFDRQPGYAERGVWHVGFGERFSIPIAFSVHRHTPELIVGIGIRNEFGEDILTSHSCDTPGAVFEPGRHEGIARVIVGQPWLRPGTYHIEAAVLSGGQLLDHVPDAAILVVDEQSVAEELRLGIKKGPLTPVWNWSVE